MTEELQVLGRSGALLTLLVLLCTGIHSSFLLGFAAEEANQSSAHWHLRDWTGEQRLPLRAAWHLASLPFRSPGCPLLRLHPPFPFSLIVLIRTTEVKGMARWCSAVISSRSHIQRDPLFYPADKVLHLKTAVTGGSLLLPFPIPTTLSFVCCSLFSQAIQKKCRCVLTGAEYVTLVCMLALLSTGSYLLLLKRKMIWTCIHRQRYTLPCGTSEGNKIKKRKRNESSSKSGTW